MELVTVSKALAMAKKNKLAPRTIAANLALRAPLATMDDLQTDTLCSSFIDEVAVLMPTDDQYDQECSQEASPEAGNEADGFGSFGVARFHACPSGTALGRSCQLLGHFIRPLRFRISVQEATDVRLHSSHSAIWPKKDETNLTSCEIHQWSTLYGRS
jgi:hypothetical protein